MITDLLASITGEKPAPASSTPAKPATATKRKAETQLPGSAAKASRTTPPISNGGGRKDVPAGSASVSRIPDRSVAATSSTARPTSGPRTNGDRLASPAIRKTATNTASNQALTSSMTNGSRNRAAPAPAGRPPPADAGPPKKKSFAEIMARAKAAQEKQSTTLGKITHKPLESSLAKRDHPGKPSEARNGSKTVKQGGTRRVGTPGTARGALAGTSTSSKDTNGKLKKGAPVEEVKKVKKAALATTGYTGTARPRPGATSGDRNGISSRAAPGLTARERSRYRGPLSGPRRRRDEEEDEDLDDFIEYDDEEEEPGYGYGRGGGYDDMDDESDMEAGLTDVEEEERRAERAARLEDKKEAELEARLKREKEERRRQELRMARR
ncbi:hypothetical protein DL546_003760 [Coniochaeta pulveracea]|uniref:SPT2 chromatin protein n=1 Tax=Coniochaeta pulveracea TaxID=177199 RepID=A0A420XZV5_9PEZI|nr:hypothetical protein DL546_003760 [Coniochaeta pulveracea]